MIHQISVKNFQGVTQARWNIGHLTLITGPNCAGKSTVSKALQLVILGRVPGDEVAKTVQAQFEAYCSSGVGFMEIEIDFGDRGVVTKIWTKSRGKVSTKTRLNGKDVPASTDLDKLLEFKVFDIIGFWRQSPSQQITILCELSGVDPVALERLTEELERANSQKKKFMEKLDEAKEALKDHEAEMQIAKNDTTEEGIDPETIEAQIAELRAKSTRLEAKATEIESSSSKVRNATERLDFLKQRMFENTIALSEIVVPEEKQGNIDDLQKQADFFDRQKDEVSRRIMLRSRMDTLRDKRKPSPPAYKKQDISELKEQIASMESGSGVSQKDRWIYEAMSDFFELIRAEKESFQSPVDYKLVQTLMRSHFGELSARVKAGEKGLDLTAMQELKSKLANMEATRSKYDLDLASYAVARDELKDLDEQFAKAEDVSYDKPAHDALLGQISTLKASSTESSNAVQKKKDLQSKIFEDTTEIERLEKQLEAMPKHEGTPESIRVEKLVVDEQICVFESSLTGLVRWKTISDLADKKEEEIKRLGKDVRGAKDEESHLQKKKADLLLQIQNSLSDCADVLLSPDRLTFELPTTSKPTDRIKFYRHKPDGTQVERGTLSGGERASYDMALGHAMVGKDGLVVQEVAEMDRERLLHTCDRLEKAKEFAFPQTLVIGHSLNWLAKERDCFDNLVEF